jgi:pimeloyl-ACP methyl ester carboxylesterase
MTAVPLAALLLASLALPLCGAQITPPEIRTLDVNGLRMQIREQGEGPLVLLLHGFPDLGYGWRHQMTSLADAGYHVVAPDLRGFGGTDAPTAMETYDMGHLTADVYALQDALGGQPSILIGHDWGAALAWYSAWWHPERYRALITLAVPFGNRGDRPPTSAWRERYGERFFYMLYFQEPGVAEAELDANPRAVFERLFASPDTPRFAAELQDPKATAGGLLSRLGQPKERPAWLTEEDLSLYTREYARTGFRGGLNWYRNFDRNWELGGEHPPPRIDLPTLFLAGDQDGLIGGRSAEELSASLRRIAPGLRRVVLFPGAGHWFHQSRPGEVNPQILSFLEREAPASD